MVWVGLVIFACAGCLLAFLLFLINYSVHCVLADFMILGVLGGAFWVLGIYVCCFYLGVNAGLVVAVGVFVVMGCGFLYVGVGFIWLCCFEVCC